MKKSILAAVAFVLGITLAPAACAQGEKNGDKTSEAKTISGVVAGVTAEGETVFDFKANRAVAVEAAYLTIVGSPKMADDQKKSGDDKASAAGNKREDVYIAWLSPKTKVCECTNSSGKSDSTKDCSLDRLEIGDRVEMKFVPRSDSQSGTTVQNDKARTKHGRHRTWVGEANSITIMPAMASNKSTNGSKSGGKDSTSSK